MRGGQHHPGIEAHALLHLGRKPAHHRAGHGDFAEQARGSLRRLKGERIPRAGAGVDEVRGGGVGVFVDHVAREQVVQVFGHHEEAISRLKLLGMLARERRKLIDRVERLALDTRDAIEPLQADARIDIGGNIVGSRIAIRHRVADEPTLCIDQDEVDAPGVDADRLGDLAGFAAFLQTDQDVLPDHVDIPAIVPAAAHLHVVKAVHLLELDDAVAVHATKHVAPA